jgi:hypothetical protein
VKENGVNLSGYPAYGGSVQVADSCIALSSNGSTFPVVQSVVNPFPETGDFSIQFDVTYTVIGDWGDGVMLSSGTPYIERTNGSYFSSETWKNRIFTLWAGDQGPDQGMIYIEMFNSLVWKTYVPGFRPAADVHQFKVGYIQGTYHVYVDGVQVASVASQSRPDTITLGHPAVYYLPNSNESVAAWSYWGWSSFKIDRIQTFSETSPPNPSLNSLSAEVASLGSFFSDHFDGAAVNTTKWLVQENTNMSGYPAYGGSVQIANSTIMLSSDGSTFPCVYSATNPFPTTGDFAVEFDFTYSHISDWGTGLWITSGQWAIPPGGSSSSTMILQLWGDNDQSFDNVRSVVGLLGKEVWKSYVNGWEPDATKHIFKLEYVNGVYTLYVDQTEVASAQSQVRPNSIGFGHPPIYYLPFSSEHLGEVMGGWTRFKIDYIKTVELPNKPSSTPTPPTAPSDVSTSLNTSSSTLTNPEETPLPDSNRIFSNGNSGVPETPNPTATPIPDYVLQSRSVQAAQKPGFPLATVAAIAATVAVAILSLFMLRKVLSKH